MADTERRTRTILGSTAGETREVNHLQMLKPRPEDSERGDTPNKLANLLVLKEPQPSGLHVVRKEESAIVKVTNVGGANACISNIITDAQTAMMTPGPNYS